MPCPLRVVYGTLIALIIAGVALFDLHNAEEIYENGGRAQVAQRACDRIWAGVTGGGVWQALLEGAELARVALDGKVILSPPCIFRC